MIHDMIPFIFPNFRIITTLAIVLMVIGGNIYQVKLALALDEETPLQVQASPESLVNAIPNTNVIAQIIEGSSGGPVNSANCGFIANSPNYTINLPERIDYMRITVQAFGGQPTLLVVGPQANDSFCVLGDRGSGLQPEISGVWEPGTYNIFIGDRTGTQHKFTLNISRSK